MSKKSSNQLYKDMLEISQEYLGPVSERFLNRQIKMHLNKEVGDITKADIKKLVKWMRPAIAHITHNQQHIDGFTSKLNNLVKTNTRTHDRKRHVKFPAR